MRTSGSQFFRTATIGIVVVGLVIFALSGYMQPLFRTAISPLVSAQTWLSSRFMAVYEFVTVPRDIASLRSQNQALESEVAGLQTQIIELEQQLREAQVLYALLDFARSSPASQYVAAAVIGRDPSPFLHYVIIDHGSDHGLRRGMPVITDQGLVGRIDALTATAARVQLVTDPGSTVNVRLQSTRTEAQITGSVTGEIELGLVSQDTTLLPGEIVLTSGLGGGYPPDLLVGQVISVRSSGTDLFQSASVQSVVDFGSLQAVLVITNFRPVDITPLIPTNP
ncbi:MAG TPA: rod shape-determining protein MreC [Anaerolineaceae bacterium]|nr:rod shape-determining protein MreC [Anaerolineaceae bacterium]